MWSFSVGEAYGDYTRFVAKMMREAEKGKSRNRGRGKAEVKAEEEGQVKEMEKKMKIKSSFIYVFFNIIFKYNRIIKIKCKM